MQPYRVLVVLGTRPEAIKLAPVIMELEKRPLFEVVVCATGQHDEMAEQALDTFGIRADYNLEINHLDKGIVPTLTAILTQLEWVLKWGTYDLVMVQGDTTSALAGAVSALYHKIPVAHVEAGLRTYDKTQPWPEEVNRRLITQIADWHFAPTQRAMNNLGVGGVSQERIHMVGNTVIDAILWAKENYARTARQVPGYMLVTAHRRENWGQGISNICEAIKRLLVLHERLHIVWPMHPNPIITNRVETELGDVENVILCGPMDYGAMLRTLIISHIILTDSGGIQEEAAVLNRPVLVLRDKTGRPEAIEGGAAKLVGTDPDRIVEEVTRLLTDKEEYDRMANAKNPFGDGHAAKRIVDALEEESNAMGRLEACCCQAPAS